MLKRVVQGMVALAVVMAPLALPQIVSASKTHNLILNPGAESGTGSASGDDIEPIPHWKNKGDAPITVVLYGAPAYPNHATPGPAKRGKNFFSGGPDAFHGLVKQVVSLKKYRTAVKSGKVKFDFEGWLGGYLTDDDEPAATVVFRDGKKELRTARLGPVSDTDRGDATKLLHESHKAKVPRDATNALVELRFEWSTGFINDAYIDNMSLVLSGLKS